jgi:AraC-like DNA-binding protein
MDAVAGLLDGPRARGAFLLRSSMDPPWSLLIRDEAPLCVVAVVRGEAWIAFAEGRARGTGATPGVAAAPTRLAAGDIAVIRGPDHYVVADRPDREPMMHILPGEVCVTPDGAEVKPMSDLGVRLWGNALDGATQLVTGTYLFEGEVSGRLLRALPRMVTLRLDSPLVGLLADEIVKDAPGQEAVLDRLLDLLLIATLREWFARDDAPGWYRAYEDPVVGPALRMLHHEPARPWTVAELARAVGVSRAALARRFNELVGEPPMAFLTGWRIALAADLLREPGTTIGAVAEQVGYGSPFALSTAFKRVRGVSPAVYRAAAA